MNIYLIRHAHAEDTTPDHARRLSKRGRQQVDLLADFFRRNNALSPDEIWHSPLARARETATLLAAALELTGPRREVRGLQPEDDPAEIARVLALVGHSVAVVGHEPHLSALASLLVAGEGTPPIFAMKKGATLALERAGGGWVVRWHVSPDLLA